MSGDKRRATAVPPPPSDDYDVEFRNLDDDAWYSVRTVLKGEKLIIKFQHFSDEEDCCFEAKSFLTFEEFKEFKDRFRPISVQLQDWECRKVKKGVSVCISHSFNERDNRFFDAVVDDVVHREHAFATGEEVCSCTFVIIFTHGPIVGCSLGKKIENLCLVQSSACLDPRLQHFLKMVKEKLQREPCVAGGNNSTPSFASWLAQDTKYARRVSCKRRPLEEPKRIDNNGEWTREDADLGGDTKYARQVSCKRRPLEEPKRIDNNGEWTREDADLGGDRNGFTLLIDNLDKDVSPSTIVEFIHTQTSLSVQAFVFPSLALEIYTKGAIMVDCQKNLEELCKFLDCPNHIVMSKRGRPWVRAKNLSGQSSFVVPIQNSMHKYQNKLDHGSCCDALKLVCSGTEEYKSGKRLVELFMEFGEHQKRLHERLAVEEQKILQPKPVA